MGEVALALAGSGRETPVSGLSALPDGPPDQPSAAAAASAASGGGPAAGLAKDLVGLAGRLAGLVGAAAVAGWSPGVLRDVLADLDRVTGAVSVARAQVLLAVRDAGAWVGSGDRSVEAWRARSAGTRVGTAMGEVRQAETLAAMPEVGAGLAEGRMSTEHVRVLTRAASAGEGARQVLADRSVREELAGLASRVDAGVFEGAVRRLVAAADPVAVERGFEEQRARRSVVLRSGRGGMRLSGVLDEVSGRVVRLALEALCPRPAEGDERSREQRQADALTAMAQGLLDDPGTGSGAAVRPHVSVLVSQETWTAWAARRAERAAQDAAKDAARDPACGAARDAARGAGREAGAGGESAGAGAVVSGTLDTGGPGGMGSSGEAGAARGPGGAGEVRTGGTVGAGGVVAGRGAGGVGPAVWEDGVPVPGSVAERVLCDCELTRVVMDAAGEPVDLGRTQRLYTGVQRRAVIARDGGCAWSGCQVPARWCEIHHIRWWQRDRGSTSVGNGVLLCSFHHHEVHRRDLSITRLGADPTGPPSVRVRRRRPGSGESPDAGMPADLGAPAAVGGPTDGGGLPEAGGLPGASGSLEAGAGAGVQRSGVSARVLARALASTRARYEFRDPRGRLIAPLTTPAPARPALPGSPASPGPLDTGSAAGPQAPGTRRPPPGPPGQLLTDAELRDKVSDPVTGISLPRYLIE